MMSKSIRIGDKSQWVSDKQCLVHEDAVSKDVCYNVTLKAQT